MKIRKDYPLYQQGVKAFLSEALSEFNRVRKSAELNRAEQSLLEARNLFLKQMWPEALVVLERMTTSEVFLNAEKAFLSATAHLYLGDLESATACNLRATDLYHEIKDRRGSFLSLHNLMVDFSRLGHLKLSRVYYERASALSEAGAEKVLLNRAMACEESKSGRYAQACEWLELAIKENDLLPPGDQHSLSAVGADIFFRAGLIDRAYQILNQERKMRGRTIERARLDFDFGVIEALKNGSPLGRVPSSLKTNPEYQLKWELLLALQCGDLDLSSRHWQTLTSKYPLRFADNFSCVDLSEAKTAFWVFVLRLRKSAAVQPVPGLNGKLKLLCDILLSAKTPMRKEHLIEKIWKVSYDPKLDARLYKLIERSKQSGLTIVNIQRAYTIQNLKQSG